MSKMTDLSSTGLRIYARLTNKPNWEGIVKRIPHRGAPDNIYIKNAWFNPNSEEDPRETPSHNPSVAQ